MTASAEGDVVLHRAAASRTLEQRSCALLPPHTLMQRAGASLARLALAIAPHAQRIWVAAGPGNNGGDGLEAAACLQAAGRRVSVTLHGDAARLPPDAAASLHRAQAAGVQLRTFDAQAQPPSCDLAVDALLGLGSRRAPAGAVAAGIARLLALHHEGVPVLAVDLPSGLDGDTGARLGEQAVIAAHTLSLLTLKPGLFTGEGRDHAGRIWLDRLGAEPLAVPADAWLSGGRRLPAPTGQRLHAQHKGSFGDVWVLGGAPGMEGAAALAASAALTAGAGRVYLATLGDGTPAGLRSELMRRSTGDALQPATLQGATVVCGCGGSDAIEALLPSVIDHAARLVLDADALNAVARSVALQQALSNRKQPTVLTPHPLEAARLLQATVPQVQADRLASASALAGRTGALVVLKGSGTVIAPPGRPPLLNPTGGPRLATPGSGDVLAGWLGGWWSASGAVDGEGVLDAVATVVQWHGIAAQPPASVPLRAADLIETMRQCAESGFAARRR